MNKKPTYKELEQDKIFWKVLAVVFICLSIYLFVYLEVTYRKAYNLEIENNELKLQLNQTEGKNYSCNFVGAIKPEDTRNCGDEFEYPCWMYSYDEFSMNKTNVYKVIKRCCEVIE